MSFRARILAAFAAFVLLSLGCSSPERWRLSVYPTGNHLEAVRDFGEYESLEACRHAARQYLGDIGASGVGTYECGKNCRKSGPPVGGITLYICEETTT